MLQAGSKLEKDRRIMKNISIILVTAMVLMGFVGVSYSIPNIWGVWTWEITDPVHVLVSPSGNGSPLTSAEYPGGATVDATIRVQLWYQDDVLPDPPPPAPISNFPGEDIWLEIPGVFACVGEANADGPTDSEGWFTFSLPLAMGGWNDPASAPPWVYVMVSGNALLDQNNQYISPTIVVNSPDINADLVVDLRDLTLFAEDYHGSFSFRSDFFWDGVIDLRDLVWMAVLFGDKCP